MLMGQVECVDWEQVIRIGSLSLVCNFGAYFSNIANVHDKGNSLSVSTSRTCSVREQIV